MTNPTETACPFCADGYFAGRDMTGRCGTFRCDECGGSGLAIDCDIDRVTKAGIEQAESVAGAEETMTYFAMVAAGGDHGDEQWTKQLYGQTPIEYAREAVRQSRPAVRNMRRKLEALRAAWRTLNIAAKAAA